MKILCTGDIHIGRRPTRLPERADAGSLSCAACWTAIVRLAIDEAVDLVALSGDVVDQDNRYFEAWGPLERGLGRLAEAGIPTVAVAGNHDFDVLPRLADDLGAERFRLLGRGGRWERWTLTRDGRPALHVDGWSFPHERVDHDPLEAYELPAPDDDAPVLGLLHADLDQPNSRYAPVTTAGLRRRPPAFWLLGHIHAPALHDADGETPVLYPGSPQAMDPGEPGEHGPWLVTLEPGRVEAWHLPRATVRYDTIELNVSEVETAEALEAGVARAVRGHLDAVLADGAGPLRWLCCRLRLTGRTPLHRQLEGLLESAARDLTLHADGATAVVERAVVDTRPALDLHALARGGDPPGVLARLLLELEGEAARAPAGGEPPGPDEAGAGDSLADRAGIDGDSDTEADPPGRAGRADGDGMIGDLFAAAGAEPAGRPDAADPAADTGRSAQRDAGADDDANEAAVRVAPDEVVRAAARAADSVRRAGSYRALSSEPDSAAGDATTALVRRQALLLLDELLAQKEEGGRS